MSYVQRHRVSVTTAADGSATAYTDDPISGVIAAVIYTKTDFDNGVDFTITGETTGTGIWTESNVNASATRCPRQPTHDAIGAASLYAVGGEPVEAPIVLGQERVKIVIAQGGNVKTGTFDVLVA